MNVARLSVDLQLAMATPGTTPNIGNLDLSDSDTDDLFASPSQSEKKPNPNGKSKGAEISSAPSTHSIGESRYDSEEAREASLRRELESVRSINQVMEGVVESLERAKGNMDVCQCFPWPPFRKAYAIILTDCFAHCNFRIHTSEHLDPNTFADRTQPTAHTESFVAWC